MSSFAVLTAASLSAGAAQNEDKTGGTDGSLSAAICPIVYRLDESPSTRGYHYTFFGNAFFINDQGYLLTAAHVLETFRNGGQPSILLARPNSPPQLLPITVIATDAERDVAILRVTPNPFSTQYRVAFLSLARDPAIPGQAVLALSLHPARPRSAQSFQLPIEDRSAGTVLSLETTQLEKSSPAAEVFLLSHPVALGQSGSPVLAADSNAVVGFIEGRWVRNGSVSLTRGQGESGDPPGAAVPIRYAIALLEEKGIAWHNVPHTAGSPSTQATGSAQPAPKP